MTSVRHVIVKDLEPFVKAMYRILEPFRQHVEKPRRVIDLKKCGFMRILSGKNKKKRVPMGFQNS